MRQIVLDTETTGLKHQGADRVIEIGCVELVDLRLTGEEFQCYLSPGVIVDPGAFAVHGISDEFLLDKPEFIEIVDDFVKFIGDDELIIHNAPFDMAFINKELSLVERDPLRNRVFDTLAYARRRRPGQQNNLDALVKAYNITNDRGEFHGALADSRLLAKVYCHLIQTEGSKGFEFTTEAPKMNMVRSQPLIVVPPTPAEVELHLKALKEMGLKPWP